LRVAYAGVRDSEGKKRRSRKVGELEGMVFFWGSWSQWQSEGMKASDKGKEKSR
jgi:hypothetical protein